MPKRGDIHPVTGLVYWSTIQKGSKRWEYWVDTEKFQHLKTSMNELVKKWQRRNPITVLANSRKQRLRQKANGHKRDRSNEVNDGNRHRVRAWKNAYEKRRKAECPIFYLKIAVRKRIRKALHAKGLKRCSRSFEAVGCSPQFLREHIEKQFKAGMSWVNRGEWHIDHRIPLASAKTSEEMMALCHYTNLQPLWRLENQSKGARMPDQICA